MEKIVNIPLNKKVIINFRDKIKITKFAFYGTDMYDCKTFLKKIVNREVKYVVEINRLSDVIEKRSIDVFSLIQEGIDYSNWHIPIFKMEYLFATVDKFDDNGYVIERDVKVEIKFTGKSDINPCLGVFYRVG